MEPFVYPKENAYYAISLVVSILLYILLIFSIVGIIYILFGALIGIIANGLLIGNLKGNNVRVSEHQFPEVYNLAQDFSKKMNLESVPAIYVVNGGGLFNAFATRFLGRNFIAIYSDVLELAYEQGEDALSFVICHELAHVKRKHLSKRFLLYPSMIIPFLGAAYSRACEYTCDRFAAYYHPDGAIPGVLALAVGKQLYLRCNAYELEKQVQEETGFWIWFSEILSTHPYVPKRLHALGMTEAAGYVGSINSSSQSM